MERHCSSCAKSAGSTNLPAPIKTRSIGRWRRWRRRAAGCSKRLSVGQGPEGASSLSHKPFVLRVKFGKDHDKDLHLADGTVLYSRRDDDALTGRYRYDLFV